jgi:hypothetical protein
MPANTIFSTLTTPPIRLANGNLDTRYRDGVAPGGGGGTDPVDPVDPVGVIFADNFNAQADWTSAMHSTDGSQYADTHLIPDGWFAVRQDPTWAPSEGYPTKHESIEILASNADKARGGNGKSYVSYRDFNDPGWNRWNSDSILAKSFNQDYTQLYVEFYISFQPGWTSGSATSKLFRISSWNKQDSFFSYGGGGNNGPIFFFDYKADSTGDVRDRMSFRSGAHGRNPYLMSDSATSGFPRSLSQGDLNANMSTDISGDLIDKKNGGTIPKTFGTVVEHEQVYGPAGTWTKLGFFVKMNSAPGVMDGEFKQWIDDIPAVNAQLAWIPSDHTMVGWNVVAIGGNDYWRDSAYVNADQHEEWYSIDDFVIRDSIPESLL